VEEIGLLAGKEEEEEDDDEEEEEDDEDDDADDDDDEVPSSLFFELIFRLASASVLQYSRGPHKSKEAGILIVSSTRCES